MSKNKKIIEIEVNDLYSVQDFIRNKFVYSVENDTLDADKKFLYAEMPQAIYKISLYEILIRLMSKFKIIYSDLEKEVLSDRLEGDVMVPLFQWTNPVFEKIGLKPMIEFTNHFKEKLQNDEEYCKMVKNLAYKAVNEHMVDDIRKKFVDRFSEWGVLDEKDKIQLMYYEDEPISKIELLYKKGNLNHDEIISLVAQVYHYEKKLKKDENKDKKKYNSKIVSIMNFLDGSDIVQLYLVDGITDDEFIRTKVEKSDIFELSYVLLLEYLENRNDKMPERLKITSKDLINEYGKSLSGNTIYKFVLYGYISLDDFIDVYEINRALRAVNYEDIFQDEELKAFYSPDTLIEMKKNDIISPRFIEKYLEMQDFENNQEEFKTKSKLLVNEIMKKIDENPQELVLYFFDIGFCDLETTRQVIDSKYFENKFENDKMSREEIFDYYKKGLIDDTVIFKYYTDSEILDLYETGEVPSDSLKAIGDTDTLIQEFCDGRIEIQDFLSLYLNSDRLSITDLSDAFELSETEYDISAFIDETTPFKKIKELFSNFLIDYASILVLRAQGVISEDQFIEIKSALNAREFFKEIGSGKKFKVMTSRKGKSSKRGRIIDGKAKEKEDFSSEMDLISRILGKNIEEDTFSLIESYNEKGKPTTLNNYRIFGNERLDGIVILQKAKKGNAVFVMNVLQLMYFLNGKENENGEFEVQDRMKDKSYLRRIEGVEVVEHSKYFGKNLVEAVARVSPTFSERMKADDEKYKSDVEKLVSRMVEKYMENKEKNRND